MEKDLNIVASQKTAVLLGASGLVGGHLLDALLRHGAYAKVIAPTRRPLRRTAKKLDNPRVNFNYLERYRGMMGCDDLYIALGTTLAKAGSHEAFRRVDYEYVVQAATLARKLGANQCLLVSSAAADPSSRFLYTRTKGQTETSVIRLDFWATHIFRPGVLLGQRDEMRVGERLAGGLARLVRAVSPNILGKYNPTEATLLAQRMLAAAQSLTPGVHIHDAHAMLEAGH